MPTRAEIVSFDSPVPPPGAGVWVAGAAQVVRAIYHRAFLASGLLDD